MVAGVWEWVHAWILYERYHGEEGAGTRGRVGMREGKEIEAKETGE